MANWYEDENEDETTSQLIRVNEMKRMIAMS